MDDIVKVILRAVSHIWPKAKPTITTQFFEADTKQPEKFIVTLGDVEQHRVSLSAEGPTQTEAMQKLQEHLSVWVGDFRVKALEQNTKDQEAAGHYHERMRKAWEDLTPPKE